MNGQTYSQAPKIVVDLRSEVPEIRDQGSRPTCLAFAASDAHSNFHNLKEHLSVEFLTYYGYKAAGHQNYSSNLSVNAVINVLKNEGQPYETDWPYNPQQTSPIIPPTNLSPIYNVDFIKNLTFSFADLKKDLDSRRAIVIGVETTESFYKTIAPPHVIDDVGTTMALHAMVLVGYGNFYSGEVAFLAKNSWGKSWANNGYSWLTESYLQNKMILHMVLK